MTRALTAIPPSPSRCRVLLPAFSTRKSCRQKSGREREEAPRGRRPKHAAVTHGNNGEDRVDHSGTDGGVDGLFHTS